MNYYSSIVGTHPQYNVFHPLLSYNLSFPSPMPVTRLIMPANNGPILRNFTLGIFITTPLGVPKNYQSHGSVSSTLMYTIPYSSVIIDI